MLQKSRVGGEGERLSFRGAGWTKKKKKKTTEVKKDIEGITFNEFGCNVDRGRMRKPGHDAWGKA